MLTERKPSSGPLKRQTVTVIDSPWESTEAEDIVAIGDYLGIGPTGREMQEITGLGASALSDILNGKTSESRRRRHTAVVGELTRTLAEHRARATSSSRRPKSAKGWLYAGLVRTSEGPLTPLEVFRNEALAREALRELRRAL
jgi:hypothetical protein